MLGRPQRPPTAAETIFLAACDLVRAGYGEFDEAALTVAAWQRDPKTFGLQGYKDLHPDHKRVYCTLVGKTGPIRHLGLMWRCRANVYKLTDIGLDRMAAQERQIA